MLLDDTASPRGGGGAAVRPVVSVDGRRVVLASTAAAQGGPAPGPPTSPVAMRQRILAEAAVRALARNQPPLVVEVPRGLGTSGAAAFFDGLDQPWLRYATVESVVNGQIPTDVRASRWPDPLPSQDQSDDQGQTQSQTQDQTQDGTQDQAQDDESNADERSRALAARTPLSASDFRSATRLAAQGERLQRLLPLNDVVGRTIAEQALTTLSFSARSTEGAASESARRASAELQSLFDRVTISTPRGVTLSGVDGSFPVTITNGLDQPVVVDLQGASDPSVTLTGPDDIQVPAHGSAGAMLRARTEDPGVHRVRLRVTDTSGRPIGATADLPIRSAQVSRIIWLVLGVGAVLLFGTIALRLVRRGFQARTTSAADVEAAGRAGLPARPPEPGPGHEPDHEPDHDPDHDADRALTGPAPEDQPRQ